jgi:uncharacterized protein YlxW (UPF0749 family)
MVAAQPAIRPFQPCGYRGRVRWLDRIPLSRLHPAVVVSGLVFALAGLMFAAAANTSQGTDLRAQRATELRDLVRQKSDRVNALEDRVAGQQQAVDDLTAGRIGDPAVALTRNQIEALAPAAGLTDAVGRALTVTLDDAPLREPDDPLWQTMSANDVIVHQADLQAVVNALWRGGAVAMQVMDQRIINTSSVQCVGNTLLLQGRVYSPPYTITAIGPVKRMRGALSRDNDISAYRAWADAVGLVYQERRHREYTIAGYTGPITMQFATSALSVPIRTGDPALAGASSQPSQ